jgi:ketosteroid isomerase-like protein
LQTDAERIAEGLAAAWSSGDVEKIASFLVEDCVFEDVCAGAVCRGHEELKARAREIFARVPDLKLEIEPFSPLATG